MKLTVLSSCSAGNCYVLQDDEEALVLEAGIALDKVKRALGFNVGKVSGCLITHSHGDHSVKAKDFEKVFQVCANADVISKRGLTQTKEITPGIGFKVGNFKVYPFDGAHDVPVLGFVINHPKIGNMLFLTDSFLCEYRINGLNHVLIECNYYDEGLKRSIEKGLHPSVAERVLTSHMELQTCVKILKDHDLSNVYNILLLHLSERNSDEKVFHQTIASATGKPIFIAKPGLEVELSNTIY